MQRRGSTEVAVANTITNPPRSEPMTQIHASFRGLIRLHGCRPLSNSGDLFNYEDLVQAVKDGARLRLGPKAMTGATIVASLLPIMWSHRQGAEVMKPLATPVIGGMISSLIHILIVTPVIFLWLRQRDLRSSLATTSAATTEATNNNTTKEKL